MNLKEKYPDKLQFYQYNTGGIGEIIEEYKENGVQKKRMVRKVTRVPINLMAALQRGDLRGTNKYQKGLFGTEDVVWCEGENLDQYEPGKFYTPEQIDLYLQDVVDGRRKFTEEIAKEGLNSDILKIAKESFQIAKPKSEKVFIPDKEKANELEATTSSYPKTWVSKVRPPRPVGY